MEKIATDIYSFENLRKDGYVYVDKTDLLWHLAANNVGRQFFISRPRRFGKSLMLSTLKCLFEGRRELFKGLKIEKKRWDWQKTWPVVMLNMADVTASSVDELKEGLTDTVDELVRNFGLKDVVRLSNPGKYLGNFFKALAAARGEFVVLVDEYDVPLQGFLGDRAAIVRVRKLMHDFYIQLKNNEANIRFLMLTGVTKLTKVSVFSGLNHLTDLTMKRKEYAALLGYTPKEIAAFFPKRLDALAKKSKTDRRGALKLILDWYDSYRFSHLSTARVCNPISVGQALQTCALQSYWVGTAVSTLVMERIAAAGKTPTDFEGCTATVDELDLCDALTLPAKSLMYQSGYLTIKGLSKTEVDGIGNPKLILDAPNHEVRGAIRDGWFDSVVKVPSTEFDALVDVAKRQFAAGDVDSLINETLYRIYAQIPPEWKIRSEADVKRHFRLFMEMLGAKVSAEEGSARGYADAIIEARTFVWVFEFKFNKSANAAVRQIREKGYANAYRGDRRPVTLVGVNFRTAKRNIDEPVFGAFKA
ncbi:MAG: AAA family ATPase [bacterium]|nr:AAA family ATPase [Candidatus Colisoma equi]